MKTLSSLLATIALFSSTLTLGGCETRERVVVRNPPPPTATVVVPAPPPPPVVQEKVIVR